MTFARLFHVLVSTALLLPPLAAQTDVAEEKPKPKNPLLQKVIDASDEDRPKALIAFINDQLATNAFYDGQYAGLKAVREPVVELLSKWIKKAPPSVIRADPFRVSAIRALRDLVDAEKVPEELMASLKKLATSYIESQALKQVAAYAMAQFGDRSLVDARIKRAEAQTKAESPQAKANGWNALADIHYNLREYEKAAKAYKQLLGLAESKQIQLGPGAGTLYYNCGCTLALAGETDEAMKYVEQALKFGKQHGRPMSKRLLETDMDISALRGDERFDKLMDEYFGDKGAKKGGGGARKPGKDGSDG